MFFSLSPLSYVFFLSFVFLIVVVLMNLLNGLAVSDTGLIQAKAEIVSYTTQVRDRVGLRPPDAIRPAGCLLLYYCVRCEVSNIPFVLYLIIV